MSSIFNRGHAASHERAASGARQALVDALSIPAAVIDPAGVVIHGNSDFLRVADSLHSQSASDGPQGLEAILGGVVKAQDWQVGGGERFRRDVAIGIRVVEVCVIPLEDESGGDPVFLAELRDVSERRTLASQSSTIDRSMATIEFDTTGVIQTANHNFLATTGYRLDEIVGQHHRMFCDPAYTKSIEYTQFWEDLAAGQFSTGEYQRFGKSGNEIWLSASYFPILDADGKAFKVLKIATDITATHEAKLRNERVAQSLAHALGELETSAREIGGNTERSATLSESAASRAEETRTVIDSLHSSSKEISSILHSITKLAGQSHMLALNATIEAARVGEAGRGFAVVASEVKQLALETAEATSSIGDSIDGIQAGVEQAVAAVHAISDEVANVTECTTGVAGAIEEQTSVIQSMVETSRELGTA